MKNITFKVPSIQKEIMSVSLRPVSADQLEALAEAMREQFENTLDSYDSNSKAFHAKINLLGVEVDAMIINVFEAGPYNQAFDVILGVLSRAKNIKDDMWADAKKKYSANLTLQDPSEKSKKMMEEDKESPLPADQRHCLIHTGQKMRLTTKSSLEGLGFGSVVRLMDVVAKEGWDKSVPASEQGPGRPGMRRVYWSVGQVEPLPYDGAVFCTQLAEAGANGTPIPLVDLAIYDPAVKSSRYGESVVVRVDVPPDFSRVVVEDGCIATTSFDMKQESWTQKGLKGDVSSCAKFTVITNQWKGQFQKGNSTKVMGEVVVYDKGLRLFHITDTEAWAALAPCILPHVKTMFIIGVVDNMNSLKMAINATAVAKARGGFPPSEEKAAQQTFDYGASIYGSGILVDYIAVYRRVGIPCTRAYALDNCKGNDKGRVHARNEAPSIICLSETPASTFASLLPQGETIEYRVVVNCSLNARTIAQIERLSAAEGDVLLSAMWRGKDPLEVDKNISQESPLRLINLAWIGAKMMYFFALFPNRHGLAAKRALLTDGGPSISPDRTTILDRMDEDFEDAARPPVPSRVLIEEEFDRDEEEIAQSIAKGREKEELALKDDSMAEDEKKHRRHPQGTKRKSSSSSHRHRREGQEEYEEDEADEDERVVPSRVTKKHRHQRPESMDE